MRINNNIASLNTYNRLAANQVGTSKSLEKLSSGLRINKAGDDAAGLAISEKMRGQIRGLNQASRNAQDGISLIQTAEGALNETHSILQRMRELGVQGANDTLATGDRAAIQTEMDQLVDEIDRIAGATQFNGKNLLDGSFGVQLDTTTSTLAVGATNADVAAINVAGAKADTYTITETATAITLANVAGDSQTIDKPAGFTAGDTYNFDSLGVSIKTNAAYAVGGTNLSTQTIVTSGTDAKIQIGANQGDELGVTIGDMTTATTGLNLTGLSVANHTSAGTAVDAIDNALDKVSTQRATLGAYQNRLEHTINNLSTSSENLTASESRIRDVDMAKEMMEFTKNNILSQAATAMMAQANQQPQGVLQLLR